MGGSGSRYLTPGGQDPGRATFLELFFDLVFVFALTRISARAFEDLALEPGGNTGWAPLTGGGKTLLLLFALWTTWKATAWTTSRYDPHHLWLQVVVITALVCSMVMGVSIPRAFGTTGLAFAVAYVVAHVSRSVILFLVVGHHGARGLKLRMAIIFSITGALWIIGALLPNTPRVGCWAAAIIVEYVAHDSVSRCPAWAAP